MSDVKLPDHYDLPSLRFSVLNDTEYAAPVLAEGEGSVSLEALSQDVKWRKPSTVTSDHYQPEQQATRWKYALKSCAGEGAAEDETSVIRDSVTGRLRPATPLEEAKRTWHTVLEVEGIFSKVKVGWMGDGCVSGSDDGMVIWLSGERELAWKGWGGESWR
jgi:hypothetical protein